MHLGTAYQSSQLVCHHLFVIIVTLFSTFTSMCFSSQFFSRNTSFMETESYVQPSSVTNKQQTIHWIDRAHTSDYKANSCPLRLSGKMLPFWSGIWLKHPNAILHNWPWFSRGYQTVLIILHYFYCLMSSEKLKLNIFDKHNIFCFSS